MTRAYKSLRSACFRCTGRSALRGPTTSREGIESAFAKLSPEEKETTLQALGPMLSRKECAEVAMDDKIRGYLTALLSVYGDAEDAFGVEVAHLALDTEGKLKSMNKVEVERLKEALAHLPEERARAIRRKLYRRFFSAGEVKVAMDADAAMALWWLLAPS